MSKFLQFRFIDSLTLKVLTRARTLHVWKIPSLSALDAPKSKHGKFLHSQKRWRKGKHFSTRVYRWSRILITSQILKSDLPSNWLGQNSCHLGKLPNGCPSSQSCLFISAWWINSKILLLTLFNSNKILSWKNKPTKIVSFFPGLLGLHLVFSSSIFWSFCF